MPGRVLHRRSVVGCGAVRTIVPHVEAIQLNLPAGRSDPNGWFSAPAADEQSPNGLVIGTNVIDDPLRPGQTCCVFLRPDRLCALQVTSHQLGLEYPGLKPLFCALYPLQVREAEIVVDHETTQNFGSATCQRVCATRQPLYRVFKEEMILILGEDGYRELDQRMSSA